MGVICSLSISLNISCDLRRVLLRGLLYHDILQFLFDLEKSSHVFSPIVYSWSSFVDIVIVFILNCIDTVSRSQVTHFFYFSMQIESIVLLLQNFDFLKFFLQPCVVWLFYFLQYQLVNFFVFCSIPIFTNSSLLH